MAEVTAGFLGRVGPKGAGALSYGLSREERRLVLLGVQMGEWVGAWGGGGEGAGKEGGARVPGAADYVEGAQGM